MSVFLEKLIFQILLVSFRVECDTMRGNTVHGLKYSCVSDSSVMIGPFMEQLNNFRVFESSFKFI